MYHVWHGMTVVSRDKLLSDLRDLNTATDSPPMVSVVHSECEGSIREYLSEFGTWYAALDSAGLATDLSPPEADRDTLIEDLQQVASEVDRSPTGDHVAEFGAYDVDTYELVFGSYLLALEAAGIDPETTQYNFAEVEPPEHRGTTKNVRQLREHGPTPSSEMPLGSSVSDRKHGMWRFVMNSGQGSTDNGGGATEAVYYLDEQHDAESVLRTFFETNDALVRNKSRHGLILGVRNHNPEWVDVAKELLDEISESRGTENATEVGVLAVAPTDETLTQAISQTARTPIKNIDVIEGVDADSGYVIGLPEEQQALWNRIDIGDIAVIHSETGIDTFTVEQTVRDWNATTEIWAQYENSVRIAGPDRPWPYLLVGTTGGEAELDSETFWSSVSIDETSEQIQYIPHDALAEIRSEYGSFWQFISKNSNSDSDRAKQDQTDAADTETKSDNPREAASEEDSAGFTAQIDSTIAFLITEQNTEDIPRFVDAHLKQAVDGIEPTVSSVTSASTAAVSVELTDTQRALITALCGDDGDYDSIDAFIEDAIRTHLDIQEAEQDFSLKLKGPTVAALHQLAETKGSDPKELVSKHISEVVRKKL